MGFMFGKDEKLHCIVDVPLKGLKDEELCVAYDVVQSTSDEPHVRFVFRDGTALDFFAEWSERRLSNQRRFLRDVPRLLGAQVPLTTHELGSG